MYQDVPTRRPNSQQTRHPVRRGVQNTSGQQRAVTPPAPTYRVLEVHSPEWWAQATRRYKNNLPALYKARRHAEVEPFSCFNCGSLLHLADYIVNNDETETMRYCRACAARLMRDGTQLELTEEIEDPDPPQMTQELPEYAPQRPPKPARAPRRPMRMPRLPGGILMYIGLVLLGSLALYTFGGWMGNTWNRATGVQVTPLSQTDAVVGHNDSTLHPSHFLVWNYQGQIDLVEVPGGDVSHMKIWLVARVSDPNVTPTVTFDSAQHPNAYVHVGDALFMLLNDGSTFKQGGS